MSGLFTFKENLEDHANPQRIYALGDEGGLLLCSWPRGNRPLLPFVYSNEVWTGIEYQVAAHLIYEGYVDEGVRIVRAAVEANVSLRGLEHGATAVATHDNGSV